MATSATVWTSTSTAPLETQVARIVGAACAGGPVVDSISLAGDTTASAIQKIAEVFNRLVKMTMSDTTLHLIAVVPLWEESSPAQLRLLAEACAGLQHKVSLHVVGLCSGLRHLFDPTDGSVDNSASQPAIDVLGTLSCKADFKFSYSLVDDYAANGAPVNFTIDSLAHYIALLQIALTASYYSILSPALLSAHSGSNLSTGISSLSFDREAVADQLLGLGFLAALDKVGINQTEVDAQKAAHTAEAILEGIDTRYPKLFDNEIRPLYKDKGLDEGASVARAASILDADIADLRSGILSLLTSESLTLPEKEAVLAMILGRDNEIIRGMQYDHKGKLLDDACQESINLYVEAFNCCCPESGLLPLRGNYQSLKKYEWDFLANELVESPDNEKALNPLPDIKRLKQQILNTTAFIRDKSDEVADLVRAQKHRSDVEEIRKKWHKPEGDMALVEYKEQPLDDKYQPAPGLKPKDSVDLRKFFPPARNQRSLGSCTSFAVASMYEAMMSRNGIEGDIQMSPAYLFYYSNVLAGRPSGGSNYFDQLKVLGSHGICFENLYPYDAENPTQKPSSGADEDADHHRALAAKQVPMVSEPDKAETLRRNHRMLVSALSEGYPVGISLKVYDNLGSEGAFVQHPLDTPDAKVDGWHAMVLVGYSEENDFYIVRNSWGPEFGDEGYCYIATSYVDDPEYNDFACIITEITDNSRNAPADVPTVLADFAATESEIRIAAIRNVISKAKVELANDKKLYADYYKYYQRLVQQLTMPNVQNGIRKAAEDAQVQHYLDIDSRKRKLEDTFVAKLKEHKKTLIKAILTLLGATVVLAIIYYFIPTTTTFISCAVSCTLTVFAWLGYEWSVKIKRRQLQDELDGMAVSASEQATRLMEMQIRFHVAGMWLNRFHKISNEIGNVYERLVSYNSTLREWQHRYSGEVKAPAASAGEMFRTVDATPLLKNFFEDNRGAILRNIDLVRLFEDYRASEESLEESHRQLRAVVRDATSTLLADFNMAEYLMGRQYPYLNPINLPDEIATLIAVGQPTYRNTALNATSPTRILLSTVADTYRARWQNMVTPCFPLQPMHLTNDDATSIVLITLHPF